jgi:hypothetical protein
VLESRWVIFAIPAAVILIPAFTALILLAVRPAKEPTRETVAQQTPPQQEPPSPPEPVTEAPPASQPAPQEIVPSPRPPADTLVATNTPQPAPPPSVTVEPKPSPPPKPAPPTVNPAGKSTDLIAALDIASAAIAGDWKKEGSTIQCKSASPSNRAKLRLVAPPPGDGYDLAITLTATGERRFIAPILSFRGRQFIFAMMAKQSGFASVRGQNALANETTRPQGIPANKKTTVTIKVRDREVSAFVDGELLSNYATDYSDLDVSNAWNLGPSSTRENLLGFAVECPVTIDAITLTPLEAEPASTAPAPSSYKELAAAISSPFSRESSAAATRPVDQPRSTGELQKIAATSQPVLSEVAAILLAGVPATDSAAREELFRAVQLSILPAGLPPDPMLDAPPPDRSAITLARADFDAEQTRLAAWRLLMGHMSDFYPSAKSQRDLVKLRFAPDASAPVKGRYVTFFASHANPEPLENVTLTIELVHAMTNPSPTCEHHYFIKRWPQNQKIFVPAVCIPNVASRELLENPGPSPVNDLGGVIEARVQLWSDKVTQPTQSISFDANFQQIAHAQLAYAYGLVDEALRRPASATGPAVRANALVVGPVTPPRADLNEETPEVARAKALARRARGLVPPQSSQADEARDLAQQPLAALRDLRKKQIDAFASALQPRSTRAGVWVVQKPGQLAKLVKPSDRDATVNAAGADGGRFTFTVDSRMADGSAINVTLTTTDQPEQKRKFSGRLQLDASANRLVLNLKATQPPPPRKGADDKRITQWNSMLLELRGNALVGIATAGPNDANVFNVAFAQPTNPATPGPAKPKPK